MLSAPYSLVCRSFYDGIVVRRRGQSSLSWPKPKIRVNSGKQGKIFEIKGRQMKEFNFNSGASLPEAASMWHQCSLHHSCTNPAHFPLQGGRP